MTRGRYRRGRRPRRATAALGVTLAFPLILASALAPAGAQAGKPAKPTPVIASIVREVSAQNIEANIKALVGFGTRHTLSDANSPTRGIGAARAFIKTELERASREAGGRLVVALDEFTAEPGKRVPQPTAVVNVVATLPGVRPESRERVYVVSGHYDSRCLDPMNATCDAPGADDDASGTAAVLELARVLAKHELDATVVFIAVAGEEQGLLGSTHFAETAAREKRAIAGMITNDIIGGSRSAAGVVDRAHVRLFAEGLPPRELAGADAKLMAETGGENDSAPRQLARALKEAGETYVKGISVTLVWRRDRYLRGGDHAPFLDRGFPAVRFTEPAEDFHRQHEDVRTEGGVAYGDTLDHVDPAYVAQVTRVEAAGLASLALAPARPTGVLMDTVKLGNDTTLRWEANRESDLAGYRIVWRETTAPTWQRHVDVGLVTEHTLVGVSKDDVVFGVEAIDRDGNVSDATYPRPRRDPPK